jgi:hypothetical protein
VTPLVPKSSAESSYRFRPDESNSPNVRYPLIRWHIR